MSFIRMLMARFKTGSCDVGSDRSAISATTPALGSQLLLQK